ncbi:uncharacterized protein LOC129732920 [Wyeomyia smithii]|uniref:uncharacterized protein LOC129732920 n=1 Tax=Wyeomyia smithii TaxID=174621 RepID=UPI002467FD9E|nr:uncharacterized protein LOC129732920 [Wyeomyia smithii]XP_055550339.1 uncharacterized protein LOC129732920 [Wyeomyia smithii]XP_055550340.1 uncharacterized protein LOC129732920 [Wyeomyia smithii]XP_055550341.1 uncharacterized protein LOC129732920 [Wyeomyia smithii]XP_055550342.1 uncharacterized protein LOC129732920 [Wyeomyia smithii]XP_055550344.1 uncharacterized protein LOC129732920 [Wyeomyia smithii]XP_055550345.1 uncharacterized protein LOC129732920 [Wyeomyia smithii]XP_055550346.1 unc
MPKVKVPSSESKPSPASAALVALVTIAIMRSCAVAAPSLAAKSWPVMKNYDIWGVPPEAEQKQNAVSTALTSARSPPFNVGRRSTSLSGLQSLKLEPNLHNVTELQRGQSFGLDTLLQDDGFERDDDSSFDGGYQNSGRRAKVLNFFPVPVDDECLSDDGLRTGQCMNVYECRIQGGASRGECALGFGVCCIFTATCDQEMANNITYFVSPSFPALVSQDTMACKLKVKLINSEITQLKFDFIHFALGQPNRRTGICDGDVLRLVGGVFTFDLCGQNSGQHLYYDVSSKSRANNEVELEMKFSPRSFTQRLWEIKVTQIPFSQRAPSGCMQYFTGTEGVIQTFNFAENGRHLANQNYRACIRQEKGMCSVAYEPCDDQSFRIGNPRADSSGSFSTPFGSGTPGGVGSTGGLGGLPGSGGTGTFTDPGIASDPLAPAADIPAAPPEVEAPAADEPAVEEPAADEPAAEDPPADDPPANDPEAEEGSGGGGGGFFSGFFPSFFSRSIFDSYRDFEGSSRQGRYSRQFFSTCRDRITLPCIVEDFIGIGMGDLPSCIPVHCGNSLCPGGATPCRVETSVTPFGLGVHFGEGLDKGSPEDNIGACLRYSQIPCAG